MLLDKEGQRKQERGIDNLDWMGEGHWLQWTLDGNAKCGIECAEANCEEMNNQGVVEKGDLYNSWVEEHVLYGRRVHRKGCHVGKDVV